MRRLVSFNSCPSSARCSRRWVGYKPEYTLRSELAAAHRCDSGRRTRHLPTLLRAAPTGVGAPLAVVHFVLRAFDAAGIADFRAKPTNLVREARTTAHKRCGTPTNLRAIAVEANARRHRGDIPFAETGVRAVSAFLRAADAGFDAGLMLLMWHDSSPLMKYVGLQHYFRSCAGNH